MNASTNTRRIRRLSLAAVAMAAAGLCGTVAAQGSLQTGGPAVLAPQGYVPGRILLMPRAGLPEAALQRITKEHGASRVRRIGNSELRIMDLPPGQERAAVQRLARHPHLKFAELDVPVAQALTPNDPYFGSQWHHARIGTSAAWDLTQGQGVTIAVLDSGVDASHPELAGRVLPGWNFYDNNSNTTDYTGHGTAVAGTLAAATNNATGVASMASQARILPIRIADLNGWAYASTTAQALTWAADNGARVANISFENMYSFSTVQSAAQYFKSKGGLVIVSAGNSGSQISVAATSTMIPVSATGSNDALTGFSSYGPYVAMSAPGENIWTTKPGNQYWYCWGTSFSAPVTAGVVALMMSANPRLSATQVESLLYSTAVDLGQPGRDVQFGYGRVNASAAVQAAVSSNSGGDTQAPTAAIQSPGSGATVSGLVAVDVAASDNQGVARVELWAGGARVATDTAAPYQFSWDSNQVANGSTTLRAVAYDAAGNAGASADVAVAVNNQVVADTTPPTLAIVNPASGSRVSGNVSVQLSASDDRGDASITQSLYINGRLVASASGALLSYRWNTRKIASGSYTLQGVARDAAGNTTTKSISVTR